MAQETPNEEKTSSYDNASQSSRHDPFDNDEEDEENNDAEVDLEGELVCAIEELRKVRKKFKMCRSHATEEQDQLNKCLQESEQNVTNLKKHNWKKPRG